MPISAKGSFLYRTAKRVLTAIFLLAFSSQTVFPGENQNSLREKVTIKKVYDGDSVLLADGREVRLLGIDAPEVHHPTIPEQRFGKEATEFVRQLAEGKEAELEFEEGNKNDKYDHHFDAVTNHDSTTCLS